MGSRYETACRAVPHGTGRTYYSVSVYDLADDPGREGTWRTLWPRVKKWTLRRVLRTCYARGYDTVSIAVVRYEV